MKKYSASAIAMIIVLAAASSCNAQEDLNIVVTIDESAGAQCGAKGDATPWIGLVRSKEGRDITSGALFSQKQVLIMDWRGDLPKASQLEVILGERIIDVAKVDQYSRWSNFFNRPVILTLKDTANQAFACVLNEPEAKSIGGLRIGRMVTVLGWAPGRQLEKNSFTLEFRVYRSFRTTNIRGFSPALAVVKHDGQYKVVGFRMVTVASRPGYTTFRTVPKRIKDWMEAKRLAPLESGPIE